MRRLLGGLAAAGIALAGCGGSSSDDMVRTGTAPIKQKADGTLAARPSPLTVQDIEKQPKDSAQRAVMQLIFWVQWGNLPAVVDAYDSRVVSGLGVTKITGTYDYLRPDLLTSRARITATRPSGGGQFVSVEFASTTSAPTRDGFLMRRRAGVWRVVYDTLLERGIDGYTTSQQDPGDPTPSIAARRSGARAAQGYRDIYPSIELAARQSGR